MTKGRPFNHERAASVLVDAAYLGDEAAAKKWAITTRTIDNYRARLKTDPILSAKFRQKRQVAEGHWADELKRALGGTFRKIAMIVESIEIPEHGMVSALQFEMLVAASKTLGEIAIAREVLNAGDAQSSAAPETTGAGMADGAGGPALN